MTDNDIKKSLESLLDRMRAYEAQQASIGKGLVEDIISMYDRQQAEIEKLNVELVGMRGACESYKMHYDNAQTEIKRLKRPLFVFKNNSLRRIDEQGIKSEAIKEFWEKLKTEARLRNHTNYGKNELATAHNEGVIIARQHTLVCGDNLVKEMTEPPIKIEHSSLCETDTYEVKE